MTKVYKDSRKTTNFERLLRTNATEKYLRNSRRVNMETGETKQYYPNVTRDRRAKLSNSRMSSPNTRFNAVLSAIIGELYFYTIIFSDVNGEWGDYGDIFNDTIMEKFREYLGENIEGPFYAVVEVSVFTGAHSHIFCGKQGNSLLIGKILKAETEVKDAPGLLKYLSKPCINPKDRNSEGYSEMVGAYLKEKERARRKGKRCPRRVMHRLKW
jgi:hypothetical protein